MATGDPLPELPVLEKTDDGVTSDVSLVTSSSNDEPIVTRRELWSYYCTQRRHFSPTALVLTVHPQGIITSVEWVPPSQLIWVKLLRIH